MLASLKAQLVVPSSTEKQKGIQNFCPLFTRRTLWNAFQAATFLACKSDPAKLPKCWFSVKIFTEKSRSCQFGLGRFLGIFLMVWRLRWPSPIFHVYDGLHGLFHIRSQVQLTIMNTNRQKIHWQAIGVWVDPNFNPKKIVKLIMNFRWTSLLKINFSVAMPGQIYRLLKDYY